MKNTVNPTYSIEDLFVYVERILGLGGVWPLKPTYVRFSIFIIYFSMHLVMVFGNLVDVFGNLELMVMNIMEMVAYAITYTMVCVIRTNALLKNIIVTVKNDLTMRERRFENVEEKKIYYEYNYMSKKFLQVSVTSITGSIVVLYLSPLLSFISSDTSERLNDTYALPFRVHLFVNMDNTRTYALMYLYFCPMIYMSMCHMTSICILVILVFHICAELSILSYRIKNIHTYSNGEVSDRIRACVQMHYKIIRMAKSLDRVFKLILLDELIGNIVVLAISMFYVLVNVDAGQLAASFIFGFFGSIALIMLYGYCFVGDQLTQQSISVQQAYYQCMWHELPSTCKRSLLICMIHAQITLHLTGGGFYIFSLYGFTEIIKTCFAYISMLRTLL